MNMKNVLAGIMVTGVMLEMIVMVVALAGGLAGGLRAAGGE